MNKKYKKVLGYVALGFLVGVVYVGVPKAWAIFLSSNITLPASRQITTRTLFNGTTTVTAVSNHASSTPTDITGARKVTLLFSTAASSTAQKSEFLVFVSADTYLPNTTGIGAQGSFQRFRQLIPDQTSATTSPLDTNINYYPLQRSVVMKAGATSTVSLFMPFSAWHSIVCVASTTGHLGSTCKATIEQ